LPRIPQGTPRVSIAVLNRNGEALLDQMFSSFVAVNTWPDIDFLIVDHGSTDGSRAVAERWGRRLPVRVIRCDRNHTFSYSCNRAAEIADGEMLFLLNNDILFEEDVVGRMVAAVQATHGLVGLKLFEDPDTLSIDRERRYHHVGIRFRFNTFKLFTAPYTLMPGPNDGLVTHSCAGMPTVTAAAVMCRRADYLALGGLEERYVYGYEDVDLGLKFRLSHGRPVVSANDIRATHGDGLTRRKRTPGATRRGWHYHNIRVLDERFGYAVRRHMYASLLAGDGLWMGRRPTVALVRTAGGPLAGLAAALRRLSWTVREMGSEGGELRGVDVLIAGRSDWPLTRLTRPHPNLLTVLWLTDDDGVPELGRLALADLRLTTGAHAQAPGFTVLSPGRLPDADAPVAPEGTWDGCAARLVALLIDRVLTRHRFAFKLAAPAGPMELAVAEALRDAGHSVRLDGPDGWEDKLILKDDVAVWLCPAAQARPQTGRMNVLIGAQEAPTGFDGALPTLSAAALADMVEALHPARMLGPADVPLPDRAATVDAAIAEWDRANPGDDLLQAKA